MPDTLTTISWKTFFAGVLCGLLVGASGFYFLNPSPGAQPVPVAGRIGAADLGAPEAADPAPVQLRSANFHCDPETLDLALELKRAGWTYVMPKPKGTQARWGNSDGPTTWWVGYWTNERNNTSSSTQPQKGARGHFVGDGKGFRHLRRGESPPAPSQIEWLCSESGGIPPR